jgi:putative protease
MKGGENMDTPNKKVGEVTHYYNKIGVGIIKFTTNIKVGDTLLVKGHATDFKQTITEMEFDHKKIESAKKGQEVGIKLDKQVREKDEVYLVN